MSKLYLLNRNRSGRLGRVLAVLGVFSLILTSAQLPALLSYGIASAAAPSTALNLSSIGNGTGGRSGILPPNNSHFKEDEVVPQRWVLDVTAPGSLTQHTITFRYEARKANAHAYDSLATWNYTQVSADRCQGLVPTDCPAGSASTFPIP